MRDVYVYRNICIDLSVISKFNSGAIKVILVVKNPGSLLAPKNTGQSMMDLKSKGWQMNVKCIFLIGHIVFCSRLVVLLNVLVFTSLSQADVVYVTSSLEAGGAGFILKWNTVSGVVPVGVFACPVAQCNFGPGLIRKIPDAGFRLPAATTIKVERGVTWAEAIRQWVARFGRSGTLSVSAGWGNQNMYKSCLVSFPLSVDYWSAGSPSGTYGCVDTPIVPVECKFIDNSVDLWHGELEVAAVGGNKVSRNISVECTGAMQLRIRLASGQKTVGLGFGVKSEIRINGMPLNSEITFPLGSSVVELSSTLAASPSTSGGLLAGADVLIFDVN